MIYPRRFPRATLCGCCLLLLSLSACGDAPGQRALSGGAIGAGTGAIIGAASGGTAAGGAIIGGAIGAIGGAVLSPDTIDLGSW
jgi:osmotically inducible lipoprotein OsmB